MKTDCFAVLACGFLSLVGVGCQPAAITTQEPIDASKMYAPNSVYTPNSVSDRPDEFAGQVTRGQTFEHEISPSLVFYLCPIQHAEYGDIGWQITISNQPQNGCDPDSPDYAGIVTPPFRGLNSRDIVGWHFRNEDNTGPNQGSVNAPQENRLFNFVLDHDGYQAALTVHDCLWRQMCAGLDQGEMPDIIAEIPQSSGSMLITHLELGHLVPGEQAWIEQMEFGVKLYLPED
ncbi:MAG: hypothetical protein JXB07_00600 [Anaerolineae bacterium]|nr:hypothetical protein [Anaerolineae bacterium]